MDTPITADYAFQIAERIEQNGQIFYVQAAEAMTDLGHRHVLVMLAEKEADHKATFTALRERLARQGPVAPSPEPPPEAVAYIRSLLTGKAFDPSVNPADYFTEDSSRQDILLTAIGMEKETILFYEALKEIVPDPAARQALDEIIRDERRHVSELVRAIQPAVG
jgi:rubrerythrin